MLGDTMQLTKLTESITQLTCSGSQIVLFELDLRLFVKWVWLNRPDIIRDIVCLECKEHQQ